MVSGTTIHKALRINKLNRQNPLDFYFTVYQNYTLALIVHATLSKNVHMDKFHRIHLIFSPVNKTLENCTSK